MELWIPPDRPDTAGAQAGGALLEFPSYRGPVWVFLAVIAVLLSPALTICCLFSSRPPWFSSQFLLGWLAVGLHTWSSWLWYFKPGEGSVTCCSARSEDLLCWRRNWEHFVLAKGMSVPTSHTHFCWGVLLAMQSWALTCGSLGGREGGRCHHCSAARAGMLLSILECHLLAPCPLAVHMGSDPLRQEVSKGVSTTKWELSGHCKLLYPRAGNELSQQSTIHSCLLSKADRRHQGLHFAWRCYINNSYTSIISIASLYFHQTFLVDMTRLQFGSSCFVQSSDLRGLILYFLSISMETANLLLI